jgi:plasmid stability protein
MPTLTVRQVDEETYQELKAQAEKSGRSMEAEVREILASAIQGRTWWARWVEATKHLRGDDLPIPERSIPRAIDLT